MGEIKTKRLGGERRVEDAREATSKGREGGAGRIRTKSKGRESKRGERRRGGKEARSRERGTARDCYGLHRSERESLKACLPAIPSFQFLSSFFFFFFLLVHPVLHHCPSSSSLSLSRHPHPCDDALAHSLPASVCARAGCGPVRACGGGGERQRGGRQEWQRQREAISHPTTEMWEPRRS